MNEFDLAGKDCWQFLLGLRNWELRFRKDANELEDVDLPVSAINWVKWCNTTHQLMQDPITLFFVMDQLNEAR